MPDSDTVSDTEDADSGLSIIARARNNDPAEEPPPFDDGLDSLKPWRRKFIEQLREIPNITLACRVANVSVQSAREARTNDAVFSRLWDEALEGCADMGEGALYQEGVVGRLKVTVITKKDGTRIETSEQARDVNALKFYLSGNRPLKFRERLDHVQQQTFEPAEAAVLKALSTGILGQIGRKMVDRHIKTIEIEATTTE